MTRGDDPILDACLDELLGGRTPPDLSARILSAWSREQAGAGASAVGVSGIGASPAGDVEPPPVQRTGAGAAWLASPEPPPVAQVAANGSEGWVAPVERSGKTSARARGAAAGSAWTSVALVGMVLCTGATVGMLALHLSDGDRARPANVAQGGPGDSRTPGTAAGRGKSKGDAADAKRTNGGRGGAAPRRAPDGVATNDRGASGRGSTGSGGTSESPGAAVRPTEGTPLVPRVTLVSDEAHVRQINTAMHRAWSDAAVSPAEPATDAEWCRRVYLRVLGRIPTVEEVDRFTASTATDRRGELIDELLGPRHAEAFAGHWAGIWTSVLLGRRDAGGKTELRDGLTEYLRGALVADRSMARIASDLIAATGSNRSGDEDYNPAVNFLLAQPQGTGAQAAGRVARAFLGARVQCAECHVHPTGAWTQDQLWQFAAFFRQMKRLNGKDGAARLTNEDFKSSGQDPHESASYFELANGQLRAAFPVFLDGTPGSRSGLVADVDRRAELAEFVTRSPRFAEAVVNRLWAHFLGYGFAQPVDDLGPHNPPSHPELFRSLASDFAAEGHDLKRLIRWIVLSEPFGLSSKEMSGGLADAPESGRRPLFARYYPRPMQPEELHKTLQLLVAARGKAGSEQARLLGQFGRTLPSEDGDGGILQRLSPAVIDAQRDLMSHALADGDAGIVRKVAENGSMSIDDKIDHLFQAALARKPSGQELAVARKLIAESPADVARGLQDIWWVLLNSGEFILDH